MKTELQDADTASKGKLPRWVLLLAIAIPLVIVWLWPRAIPEPVAKVTDPCPAIYPECTGAAPPPMPEWNIPTDPQERAAYDYAHGLPLPAGTPEPVPFDFKAARMIDVAGGKSVAQQYFEHLCRTEGGEYIARKVQNVDGFLLMRPRGKTEGTPQDLDRHGTEEPVGFGWFNDEDQFVHEPLDPLGDYVQPLWGVYRFVEFVQPNDPKKVVRVQRALEGDTKRYPHGVESDWRTHTSGIVTVPYLITRITTDQIHAKYAYTWRGLRRSRDREFGIGGGEFFLVDRVTNEVLAMKRTFNSTYAPRQPNFTRWSAARDCKPLIQSPPLPYFVMQVLQPDIHVNDVYVPANELKNYHQDLKNKIETGHAH